MLAWRGLFIHDQPGYPLIRFPESFYPVFFNPEFHPCVSEPSFSPFSSS